MKNLTVLIIILLSFNFSNSQAGEKLKERIRAQKVAFITDKLDLTAEEATKFWPIYNTSEEQIEKVRTEDLRIIKSKIRQNPNMSDKEADNLLQDLIAAEDAMHRAKIDLMNNLKGVISSKKIIRLKRAEEEFNQKLLERLKDMRNRRRDRN